MNMINRLYQEEAGFAYEANYDRAEKAKPSRSQRFSYSRRKAPSVFNGIHRRRNKRFAW